MCWADIQLSVSKLALWILRLLSFLGEKEGFEGFCKAKLFNLGTVASNTGSYSSSDVLVVLELSLPPSSAFSHKHIPYLGGIHWPNSSRANIATPQWNWNPIKQFCQDTTGLELASPLKMYIKQGNLWAAALCHSAQGTCGSRAGVPSAPFAHPLEPLLNSLSTAKNAIQHPGPYLLSFIVS